MGLFSLFSENTIEYRRETERGGPTKSESGDEENPTERVW